MTRPTAVVVHHSASPRSTTVEQIRAWHRARGWRDIGYHRLLRQPSADLVEVLNGRPFDADSDWEPWEYGAHSEGENSSSVGVCCIGDFSVAAMPQAMRVLLVGELASICRQFGLTSEAVRGHREMPGAATECPGKLVSMSAIRADVRAALGEA